MAIGIAGSYPTQPGWAEVTTARWAAIKLFAMDVDGVLTDGSLTFDENGSLIQTFHVRDGFGLVVARRAGLKIAWISGRPSKVAQKRFEELGLDYCLLACGDKAAALRDLQQQHGFNREECCYLGDDLPDLPAFAMCGLNIAVADAVPAVAHRADYVTQAPGGHGAVREVVELIMTAQGQWENVLEKFTNINLDQPAVENMQR
ncbi:MAG: HAD hydrolase family protein [Abitibacteriaceae bacterium]|nr:HAD hydrolase family protein [Abditibacteriaceae bacterium]